MGNSVIVVETPRFPTGVFDIFKTGDAGIAVPDFTPPPGANVKDMVEYSVNDATMTNGDDSFFVMALNYIFNEEADPDPEMDVGFPFFHNGGDRGEWFFAAPEVGVFRR